MRTKEEEDYLIEAGRKLVSTHVYGCMTPMVEYVLEHIAAGHASNAPLNQDELYAQQYADGWDPDRIARWIEEEYGADWKDEIGSEAFWEEWRSERIAEMTLSEIAEAITKKAGKPWYNIVLGPEWGPYTDPEDHNNELIAWAQENDNVHVEPEPDDFERELRDYAETNYTPPDIYEWWFVSDWFGDKLTELGETVLVDDCNNRYWGRCTTGQAILLDGVVRCIVRQYPPEEYPGVYK